ncbi:M20/M25/M40 family metallo-hydrolase [Sphingobacterium chungjuense]|uniref:M20/M25/M40 family metallo-hydrolase n=1 Tax=Sphingobacterium chungjuense TaxID=2675553 RepID=UPI0019D2B9A9|nr:M20/M25/M40 family metallo-hydrolase [Sphingobacterium chungjuense]
MYFSRYAFWMMALFVLLGTPAVLAQSSKAILKQHIYYLASDEMKGRETGSAQVEQAAQYIEAAFKNYGLQPKGTDGYRQDFTAKITRVPVTDSLRAAANIIGFLDNGAARTIVIGAHYDHLGHGTIGGSRDTLHIGEIHNGADDNASGVAGLLELARHYSQNEVKESFNLLFIAFGAEELGLLGSKHFTQNPTVPLNQIHWMLNMDMIGRYQPENGLAIIGHGTSPAFVEIFDGVTSDIKFYTSKDGNGGSDQTSFYKKDIPVLFFHTGGHPDYHMASDDADKIDYKALQSIVDLEIKIIDKSMHVAKMPFQWTN